MGPFSKPYRVCHSLPQILSVVQSFSKSLQGISDSSNAQKKSLQNQKICHKKCWHLRNWRLATLKSFELRRTLEKCTRWAPISGVITLYLRAKCRQPTNSGFLTKTTAPDGTRGRRLCQTSPGPYQLMLSGGEQRQKQPQPEMTRTLISFGLGGSRVDSWPNVTHKCKNCHALLMPYDIPSEIL